MDMNIFVISNLVISTKRRWQKGSTTRIISRRIHEN